jgi:hypothetical protein
MDREAREYWRQQRRLNLRNRSLYSSGDVSLTYVLLGLLVAGWLLQQFLPGMLALLLALPGAPIIGALLSTILPGGFLGLVFEGVFVWLLGMQIEGSVTRGQYLLVFFVGGAVGAVLAGLLVGAVGLSGSFSAFALAGAYTILMAAWAGRGPALQWVVLLLLLNIVLTGFNIAAIVGMLGAFGAGAGIVYLSRMPRRFRRWP